MNLKRLLEKEKINYHKGTIYSKNILEITYIIYFASSNHLGIIDGTPTLSRSK